MPDTTWTLSWPDRPTEEAALFNPAFCGELVFRCVSEYEAARASPMPLALAFIVLPLTLHVPTRELLPGRSDATLVTWAMESGPQIADLPRRVLSLRPATREAILFMGQYGALTVGAAGLSRGKTRLKLHARRPTTTDDAEACRRAAGLLGRWFANQAGAVAVLQTLGLRL